MFLAASTLSILALVITPLARADRTNALAVGLVFPDSEGAMFSAAPHGRIVLGYTTRALIRIVPGSAKFELDLASALNASADQREWRFNVPQDAVFVTTQRITQIDLDYSLNRCREQGGLDGVESLNVSLYSAPGASRAYNEVKFSFKAPMAGGNAQTLKLIKGIADCPILERSSSLAFGSWLGVGTNLISAGDFRVVGFSASGETTLQRVFPGALKQSVNSVTVKDYASPEQALTALRLGNLDLFFGREFDPYALKAEDPTLEAGRCGERVYLARHDLNYRCEWGYDLNRVGYVD